MQRFAKDDALEQLFASQRAPSPGRAVGATEAPPRLTIAYDKSIVIGKKKWNDIVVMRSTLHLNKSTCFYKPHPQLTFLEIMEQGVFVPRLKDWQQSLDAALECLVGNHRDEMLFTDPHIRQKLKESEAWPRKSRPVAVLYLYATSRAKVRAKIGSCWRDPRGVSCGPRTLTLPRDLIRA